MEFTREWFQDENNQVHTRQDIELFKGADGSLIKEDSIIEIGDHFLLDLIPVHGNGKNRDGRDVEIWKVTNTKRKHYCKERKQWFNFIPIKKITTGKQFGYPNGYWKVPEFTLLKNSEVKQ